MNVSTNARKLQLLYNRRAASMARVTHQPKVMAVGLFKVRAININNMIYQNTPYRGMGKRAPTGNLASSEVVIGDTVYNSAPYASIRMNMKGDYKEAPGVSKDADFARVSFKEFLPAARQMSRIANQKVLRGI